MTTALSNPDAEGSLVGLALTAPSAFDDARCEPEDFELPQARLAWEAIAALKAAGENVSPIAVMDKARKLRREPAALEMTTLAGWAYNAVPGQAEHMGRIVRTAAVARRLASACADTLSRLKSASVDALEALADHRSLVGDIDSRAGEDLSHFPDTLVEVLEQISSRCEKRGAVGIPTGIKAFDMQIGGLRLKTQTVVAARPGQGKSAWSKTVAINAAKNHGIPVLIFSLEMAIQEQVERILSSEADISLGKITSGRLEYEDHRKLAATASKLSKGLPIWIYDRTLSVDRFESITRRWHARHVAKGQLSLVICDYLGLVKSPEKRAREQEVAAVSMAGKGLAMQLGCATIMVAQLNRNSEKEQRDPMLSDLRESGSIEQDADMVVFPIREEGAEDNTGSGPARIVVAKNRGGPRGEVPAYWEGRFTRFCDRNDYPLGDD